MGAAQNYVSISRRPPDVEDYIDIMRRYRSWIIGPMFAGLVISVVVAYAWPDTFVSRAVLKIRPQQVSQRLVPAELTSQMGERLNQMEQDILSVGTLSAIIQQPSLNLYPKERQQKPMEDVVQDMRNRDIKIQMLDLPGSAGGDHKLSSAFAISFSYTDKYKAQAVVRDLVAKFMEQTATVQRNETRQTTTFLDDELKIAKQHLEDMSAKVTTFKAANFGRLPEQAASNVAALNSFQLQLTQASDSLSRAQAAKSQLETSLSNFQGDYSYFANRAEEVQYLPGQASPASVKSERLIELDRQLIKFQSELASLKKQYRDSYPLIPQVQAQISQLEEQKAAVAKEDAAAQAAAQAAAPATTGPTQVRVSNPAAQQHLQELKNAIQATRTNIANTDVEIQSRQRQIAELNKKVADYQARIDASPLNEQQYAQLMADYTLAKQDYDEKVKKQDQAFTMQNLEEHKAGETLEVLDTPSLPETSNDPNRPAWIGIGTAMGLMVGIVLAAAKEVKNTSLKNLKDVRAYTNLPVLSSVPLLENALLVRRKRRLFWLAWSSAFIVGTIAMTGSMYYHFFGKT
jgi:succinoglycan biosynthesis transport protein ExoP